MLHIIKLLKNKFIYCLAVLMPLSAAAFAFCAENNARLDFNPILSPDTLFNHMSVEDKIMQLYIYNAGYQTPTFGKNKPQGLIYNTDNFHELSKLINSITDTTIAKPLVITDISKPFVDLPVFLNYYAVATSRDTMLFRVWSEQMSDSLAKAGVTVVKSPYTNFSDITGRTTDKELFAKTANAKLFIKTMWQNGITVLIESDLSNITDKKRREFVQKSIDSLYTLGKRLYNYYKIDYPPNALIYKTLNRKEDIIKTIVSNADLIIGTLDPEIFLKTLHTAIKKNKKLRKVVELKAYKIIKLKYWVAEHHEKHPTRTLPRRLVSWKAISSSNTCIYNSFGFLPIKDINNLKII